MLSCLEHVIIPMIHCAFAEHSDFNFYRIAHSAISAKPYVAFMKLVVGNKWVNTKKDKVHIYLVAFFYHFVSRELCKSCTINMLHQHKNACVIKQF